MSTTDQHDQSALLALAGDEPGYRLVHCTASSAPPHALHRFSVLPPRGPARLLAPIDRSAMNHAVGCFFTADGVRGRGLLAATRAAVPLRRLAPSLERRIDLVGPDGVEQSPLHRFLAGIVGTDEFDLAIRLTSGRPNAKLVIAAISAELGPMCFAKFGLEPLVAQLVHHEAEQLSAVTTLDLPFQVPQILYAGQWSGTEVLVTSAMRMRRVPRRRTSAHRAVVDLFDAAESHRATLATSSYWQGMKQRAARVADAPLTTMLEESMAHIERRWGSAELEFGRGHGDWVSTNVGVVGDDLVVFDWERSDADLPRLIDLAHFAVVNAARAAGPRLVAPEVIEERAADLFAELRQDVSIAPVLVVLALFEMTLRFAEARSAGLPVDDTKYGPVLRALMIRESPLPSR